jgi:tellurite resistance protein TerC
LLAVTIAIVVALLAVDFLFFARRHVPSLKESALWSVGWILVAIAFGLVLTVWQGGQTGSEYFAGYILERTLSLDNVFVFAVLLGYFAVPVVVQPKVLGWGIAIAVVLRLLFIVAGAALLDTFHATFYLFGALLLYTAYRLARGAEAEVTPDRNPVMRLVRRLVPMTEDYDGDRLITRRDGRRIATPLVAVFAAIATTDVIFAVDSIPAIFAVTTDAFVVFAANGFAMLGLRALYFLVAGMRDRFVYLSQGLAVILAFVGLKMLLIDVWHVPIWLSLGFIVLVLAAAAVLSLRAEPERSAA